MVVELVSQGKSMTNKAIQPDFMAIGPEKAETLLLCELLSENPQTSLPLCKEIRYWNEKDHIPL